MTVEHQPNLWNGAGSLSAIVGRNGNRLDSASELGDAMFFFLNIR